MPEPLQEIAQVFAAAERASAAGFAARAAASEALALHGLDRLEALAGQGAAAETLDPLRARARALLVRLEGSNGRALERLRARIRAGRYSRTGLRRTLVRHGGPPGPAGRYDGMDLLLQGLLGQAAPADPQVKLGPDMVPYQPTPARAILDLLGQAALGPDDLLVDLGSGLGQVVLLSALLSGARARGIELEAVYVDHARRCAQALAIEGVDFVQADAREAPLAGGSVYYLFTPFRGALLGQVLQRLQGEAKSRSIKLCTYGHCTTVVAKEPWLVPARSGGFHEHRVAVFQNR